MMRKPICIKLGAAGLTALRFWTGSEMLTHRAIQLPRHYSALYHIQNGDLQALAIGAGARLDLCMRGLIVNIYLHPARRLRAAAAAYQPAGCKPA